MRFLPSDLRFVLRSLAKNPLFVVVSVVSLALGIGANTAIFTLMDQVLLRSLPVKNPEQLVLFDWEGSFSGMQISDHAFSYPMYTAFRDKTGAVLSGLAAEYQSPVDIGWKSGAERAQAELVSGNYFDVLGVGSAIGRTLSPNEDKNRGGEPYLVLSYGYWQRRFGSDRQILNQTVDVNGRPFTVIGVAERGFKGTDIGSPVDVFVPMAMNATVAPNWDQLSNRLAIWLHLIGRRLPGVSLKQAESAARVVYRQEQREDLKANKEATEKFRERYLKNSFWLVTASKGVSTVRDQFSTPLIVLMAMVGTLLLIACGNVANLLVARAAGRQREIAIRLSLGANKRAVVRLVLLESAVLSLTGAALGLLVAWWSGSLLLQFLPFEGAANAIPATPDERVLLFTLAISVLTALIFGAVPAIQAAKPDIAYVLKTEATSVIGGGHVMIRKGLVAAQISLSLLLLVGTGLFARSLHNLMSVNPGVSTRHILEFSLDPTLSSYSSERTRQALRTLNERLASLPGVETASGAEVAILSRDDESFTTRVEGYEAKDRENLNPQVNRVLPGFFSTLKIAKLAGRDFTQKDTLNTPKVAIVNEEFVRYFFGSKSALGRHIGFGNPRTAKLDTEIVGVVANTKTSDLKEKTTRIVFVPELQAENPANFTFYLRSVGDPQAVESEARIAIHQFDSRLPVYSVKTLETQVNETHYIERLTFALSAAFGLLATLLAAFGLYGVMAFTVTRRTREIGIRMALGAARSSVLSMVMTEVLLLTATGIVVALPLAFGLGKLIESQLFQVNPADLTTMFSATAFLVIIAIVAGIIPARYASKIDPLHALRWE